MPTTTKTISDMRIIENGSLPGHIATGHPERHDIHHLDLVKVVEEEPLPVFRWVRETANGQSVATGAAEATRDEANERALKYNRPPYILFHEYDGVAAALEG